MTFADRQDQFAEWVESVLRPHNTGTKPKFWLLRLAGAAYYPIYALPGGIRSFSVCYVFRRGSGEELPKLLNGGDLGMPDSGQMFKVFDLDHGWKHAAIRLDASEEMSSTFEWMVKARIVQAVEAMEKP